MASLVIETHPSLGDLRERCFEAVLEDRLRIVEDLTQPLPTRALAAWLSSGIQAYKGRRVGTGDLERLGRVLVALGASNDFVSSMIFAAKRTREPMVVLVPLIWLEAQRHQQAKICKDVIPDSPVIGSIPMHAFDKHTRVGLAAIHRLIHESNRLRCCLEQYIPQEAWRKAAQMAAFYTDAYLVSLRLEWSLSRPLETLGIESDFARVGVPLEAIGPLRCTIWHELDRLNGIR